VKSVIIIYDRPVTLEKYSCGLILGEM